jgi:hypothetical protein
MLRNVHTYLFADGFALLLPHKGPHSSACVPVSAAAAAVVRLRT